MANVEEIMEVAYRDTPEWRDAKRKADEQNRIQSEKSKTTPFRFYPLVDLSEDTYED